MQTAGNSIKTRDTGLKPTAPKKQSLKWWAQGDDDSGGGRNRWRRCDVTGGHENERKIERKKKRSVVPSGAPGKLFPSPSKLFKVNLSGIRHSEKKRWTTPVNKVHYNTTRRGGIENPKEASTRGEYQRKGRRRQERHERKTADDREEKEKRQEKEMKE
ncbi:hypothetical protein RUM43_008682 [Polyplax serrata]|uniref:Uncharacterized protein n=1 Tax=Polyplax serrata TaxID=468196 RepID=A0AAN8P686_POLSC